MPHDAEQGARPAPPGDSRAEAFLRMLAERELRWVMAEPDPGPAGEPPASPDCFAAGAGGARDQPLPRRGPRTDRRRRGRRAGRSRRAGRVPVGPGVAGETVSGAPFPVAAGAAALASPAGGIPAGRPGAGGAGRQPVPFPGDGDQDRRLHLLTVTLAPELTMVSFAGLFLTPARRPRHRRPTPGSTRADRPARPYQRLRPAGLHRRPRHPLPGGRPRRFHHRRDLVVRRVPALPGPPGRRSMDRRHPHGWCRDGPDLTGREPRHRFAARHLQPPPDGGLGQRPPTGPRPAAEGSDLSPKTCSGRCCGPATAARHSPNWPP